MSQEELRRQEEALAREWRKLELERKKHTQDKHLCDMKWKVMESELKKMAAERQLLEEKKAYFYQVDAHAHAQEALPGGDVFFKGIADELALKKRYKDLLKIFHPDNPHGDTYILQIINRQYDVLKEAMYG